MISNLSVMDRSITRAPNLKSVRDDLLGNAAHWVFNGSSLGTSQIDSVVSALDNSMVPFANSTRALIWAMQNNPQSYSTQIEFARSIDADLKATALRAKQAANDLGDHDFESKIFDKVIQDGLRKIDFQRWVDTYSTIRSQISMASHVGGPLKSDLVTLVVRWKVNSSASDVQISNVIAGVDNIAAEFPDVAKALIQTLDSNYGSGELQAYYAKSLTGEMKSFAAAIIRESKQAGFDDRAEQFVKSFLQNRPTLDQLRSNAGFWTALNAFAQRDIARSNETRDQWSRRDLLDQALNESWTKIEFDSLEKMADIAKYKDACSSSKSVSALMDCVGLSLFSKLTGKMFDPAFNGRYMVLGDEFRTYLRSPAIQSSSEVRDLLSREFFGVFNPIWSRCSAVDFQQKQNELRGLIQIYSAASQSDRFEISIRIRRNLSDCF